MSLYLYGASGHGKVIAEIAEENGWVIEAFIDRDLQKKEVLNYPVIHVCPQEEIAAMVSIGDNATRRQIVEDYPQFRYATLIHPKTAVSKSTKMGEGSVVMAGAVVNSGTQIGKHCIINTNASIDHDCKIADYVHISPNAALAGEVTVGEGTHVGIGACVIQGIKIGKWATIGAGAVVIRNVPSYAVVVGNPAKVIKMNNVQDEKGGK